VIIKGFCCGKPILLLLPTNQRIFLPVDEIKHQEESNHQHQKSQLTIALEISYSGGKSRDGAA